MGSLAKNLCKRLVLKTAVIDREVFHDVLLMIFGVALGKGANEVLAECFSLTMRNMQALKGKVVVD